jgi:hypothetical protein
MRCRFYMRVAALAAAFAGTAEACTIPVFRYALDRWEADPLHLVLPAAAAQDAAVQDLLRPLRANGKANLNIATSADPARTAAELKFGRESEGALWSGALEAHSLAALLDSPMRKRIVESILAGDSLVWVIVEGGAPEDAAEAERIEKRLKFLEQVAALPIQDPNDPDSQLGPGPPLKLKFTTLRLRRDDPAEAALVKMLAGPRVQFDPMTSSFAAVVFGRGRVLGAWPLGDLDDAALEEASLFLVGRCSCRLKNQNPGWDLLLNVDWDQALQSATAGADQPTAVASSVAAPTQPDVVTTAAAPEPAGARANGARWSVAGVAGGLMALALAALWWRRRMKRN